MRIDGNRPNYANWDAQVAEPMHVHEEPMQMCAKAKDKDKGKGGAGIGIEAKGHNDGKREADVKGHIKYENNGWEWKGEGKGIWERDQKGNNRAGWELKGSLNCEF